MNREAASSFKPVEGNLRPIRARMREGFALADAEAVVRAMVAAWKGSDMAQYLRPMTLFGPKFDSYRAAALNGSAIAQRPRDAISRRGDPRPTGGPVYDPDA